MNERSVILRQIPSVDRVLRELEPTSLSLPRPVVVAMVRRVLTALRSAPDDIAASPTDGLQVHDRVMMRVRDALADVQRSRIQPVLNGTGIAVHTNFGRSPLSPAALEAVVQVGGQYNNLEYDLNTGERGRRAGYLEDNLALLCQAQSAAVVNNCAAALLLVLRHYTAAGSRREVIISRGELVQIGGGFRIPEILEASGAVLREVGTTNKTALADYESAVGDATAMILKVHRSNFYMDGFVDAPTTHELADLAQRHGLPMVEDLGSGAVFETTQVVGEHEPTPAEVLAEGADLVCFSGDKLLGGPQAGIIAGRDAHVQAIKRNPFFRALRCDKMILAALQATVEQHLAQEHEQIPLQRMLRTSDAELRERAHRVVERLKDLPLRTSVGRAEAQVGGGTLPRTMLPSVTLDIVPEAGSPQAFAARLRRGRPPVVGYVSRDRFKIDLRTILPHQDDVLVQVLNDATHAPRDPHLLA